MNSSSEFLADKNERAEQENKSALLPGFLATDQGILDVSTGKNISDISVDFLGLSARAKNALYRWGTLSNKLTNGILKHRT